MMRQVVLVVLLATMLPTVAGAEVPAPLYSFPFVADGKALTLEVTPVFVNGKGADFFDHRVDKHMNLLLVHNAADKRLYYSRDMAQTWTEVPDSLNPKWRKGFITEQGNLLLWDGQQLTLMDLQGKVLATRPDMPYMWQGSTGVGQSGNTMLYAEYSTHEAKELRVLRSEDAGKTWQEVFRETTDMSDNPQIEHFHLVQPDPYYPEHWYLSSGDKPDHCRVWLSKDDGKTWKEVTDPTPVGTESQSVHRFTMLIFARDYLYWGTDDVLPGTLARAKVVRCRRGEPLEVEIIGTLGKECIRNTVPLSCGMVLISEAKYLKSNGATVDLLTRDEQLVHLGELPRRDDPKLYTGFTNSLGSKTAVNGEFFTYGDPRLTGADTAALRWRLRPAGDLKPQLPVDLSPGTRSDRESDVLPW